MKPITTLDQYYQVITTVPHSIIIFSSLKTCHPCRLLKKWLEEHETYSKEEHIYDIDVMSAEFDSITNDIDCMPTIIYQQYSEEQKRLEGFNKSEITNVLELFQSNKKNPVTKPVTIL
jgi:hypothetical protein